MNTTDPMKVCMSMYSQTSHHKKAQYIKEYKNKYSGLSLALNVGPLMIEPKRV
jgi:hypothetical protein